MSAANVASALAALSDQDKIDIARQLIQAVNFGPATQVVDIDLGTAKDINIPQTIGPFTTFYVQSATDSAARVSLRLNSKSSDSKPMSMGIKDIYSQPYPTAGGYLHWDAQPGKTMTIVLLQHGNLQSGNTISQISGGVTVSEGTIITARANAALSLLASTATILAPLDSARKSETLYNGTGQTIWLGDSTVTDISGLNPGIPWVPGSLFIWKNTAALYGFSTVAIAAPALISRVEET